MNWTFDDITPVDRSMVNFSLEGGAIGWLKKFAAERKISQSHAARGLVTEAVRYWTKNRQSLERRNAYPFAIFEGRGKKTKVLSVTLDADVHEGLREIATLMNKTASHVVSEILMDAKRAAEEIKEGRSKFGCSKTDERISPRQTTV